jgi:YVTN family beta-propeller protein
MNSVSARFLVVCLLLGFAFSVSVAQVAQSPGPLPGMPPVENPNNIYAAADAGMLGPDVKDLPERVYVPNLKSSDVYVIDPATFQVVDKYKVGGNPQHIIPSWDMKTLWVAGSAERNLSGMLIPIDPKTGKPGETIKVQDAYNMYFTPDGTSAVVVAEAYKRLEFRDPHTMKMQYHIQTPGCSGVNHADFSMDGTYAIFTCEFSGGGLAKIDLAQKKVAGYLKLSRPGVAATHSMPQDIRISPDGTVFFVADMEADGVFVIDAQTFKQIGFIPTARGSHGLYPSRDGKKLYVTNRGTHMGETKPRGMGSISVIDFATRTVEKNWPIPGGGSPDMGNVSADGKTLWVSGRFDGVVYAIDTTTGAVKTIPVGTEPHGLTIWPQPGRYSLGHTGIFR